MRWLVSAATVAALAGGGSGAPAALASPAGEPPGSAIVASSLGHPGDAVESAPAAQATPCPTLRVLSGSNFEIDVNANLRVDGASPCIDWLTGGAGTALRAGVLTKNDKPTGDTDDSFGQGSKEDDPNPTIVDGSIPPNKSDLKVFGIFTETTASGKFLELFWSRINSPQGTTNMDFELNQKFCDPTATPTNCANNGTGVPPETPVRTVNDKLITYDLSQGGTVPTISIRTWTGSAWGSPTVISGPGGTAVGSVNTSAIPAAESGGLGPLDPFTFGEAAISFTALFPGGGQCGTFGSAYLKSRSSDAFNSELKDFIAPQRVLISNCPTALITNATPSVTLGSPISDTATLSGATANAGGTITFRLFSNATCTTEVTTGLSPVTVNGNGSYNSGNFTPTAAGTYYWIASYSGDAFNNASLTQCGDANESSVVNKASPTIVTSPNPTSGTVGVVLNDSATLAGGVGPTGTIVFRLYGPNNATCDPAGAAPVFEQTVAVSGNGIYSTTTGHTTTQTGTFHWTASYSGDANNNAVASVCAAEAVAVNKASPTIVTSPNPTSGTVGVVLNDSATLAGGVGPTGTIVFRLYGPNNATCDPAGAAPVFEQTVAVSGNGIYSTTTGHTTTQTGTFHWTASYSGDANNNAVASVCAAEAVAVGTASPTIVTSPNPTSGTVGVVLNDSATLAGGVGPTGTIVFRLYGPNNATCDPAGAAPVFEQTVAVSGNGIYSTTTGHTTTQTGTFHWTASYSGDANNNAVASVCAAEAVAVNKASPTIVTSPNPTSGTVGVVLNDSATLAGGVGPTGTIVFRLYGPNNATCDPAGAAPVFEQTVAVSGNGIYSTTTGHTTTQTGTFHWTASYSGDANNNAVASVCAAEAVTVPQAPSSIATAQQLVPQDTATVSAGAGGTPTGSVTFNLYGPNNATCDPAGAAPVFTQTVSLDSNGSASTSNNTFSVSSATASIYRWRVDYGGDATHEPATSACGTEQFTLTIANS